MLKTIFKVFLWLILGGISFGVAYGAELRPIIPGPNPPETGPFGAIGNLYILALGVSGLLAFGSIVYGAIVYTLAAGNPGGQNEGKEWIKQALLGLLLLTGAYIILNTINPALVNPGLSPLEAIGDRPPDPVSRCVPEQCNSLFARNDPPGGFCYNGGCYSNRDYLPGGIRRGTRYGCLGRNPSGAETLICSARPEPGCADIISQCTGVCSPRPGC